ncbi:MAG: hypothetical protein IPL35_12965 [Sphingobacteriales bacterium]|nr:hypothetical protein [Sphingobacteriales bacterium]
MKKNHFIHFLFAVLPVLLSFPATARENIGSGKTGKSGDVKKTTIDCLPANSQTELNINNVRTTLMTGGDMWWNLDAARYEVPKVEKGSGGTSRHSLFAGALWIGGIDALGQLKIAAQTYRQTGNDFFPDHSTATDKSLKAIVPTTINSGKCAAWI